MIGFFPIQILIFRMLHNNAYARRCSYFELGLPVVQQSTMSENIWLSMHPRNLVVTKSSVYTSPPPPLHVSECEMSHLLAWSPESVFKILYWSIDSSHKKVSPEQCHMTVSRS